MHPTRLAVVLLLAAACSREGTPPAAPATLDASVPAPGAPADLAYVTSTAPLRRAPTEASRVPGSSPRATVANFVAWLQRGEKVTVVESRQDWARVRASDETEGWLRRNVLLPAQGVTEATVLAEADAFDRPDLLAVNATRKVEPGTLVLVVRSRELFSEVNLSSGASAWLLTDRLSSLPRNVMMAKLIEKARWLVRTGKADDAKAVLALARKEFADVPLVEVLAQELGEAPDGGTPDGGAGGEAPPGAGAPRAP